MSRPSALLVMGDQVLHHSTPGHYEFLPGLLGGPAGLNVHVVDELASLTQLSLGDYDLIVKYHSHRDAVSEPIDALWAAVKSGTPLLALHAAPYTVKDLPGGKEAIGTFSDGSFLISPHHDGDSGPALLRMGVPPPIPVKITDQDHPITAGVQDFIIEDEGYRFRSVEGTQIQLLATYSIDRKCQCGSDYCPGESRGDWPIIYNKQLGRGKIHVNGLGHNLHAFTNLSYRRLIVQAVDWLLAS